MTDSAFDAFRELNRENLHRIWCCARDGKLEDLTEKEQRLGKIMLQHSEEYFNQFEFADVVADREFDPESEVNPFLRVVLHAVTEKQLEDRDPIEAFQFYNAMVRNKCTRHEAIHLLMAILIRFLFPMLKTKSTFPLNRNCELLKKNKSRKPDRIIGLLENEPDPVEKKNPETTQILDQMLSTLENQKFQSIDEAQDFLDAWSARRNTEAVPAFLGLSREQMHHILYRPFEETSDIVTLNKNISREEVADVPVVVETVYFLKRLGELEPLKATIKGNLRRAFAQEMHRRFPEAPGFDYPIMSEEEDWKLSALRHILDMGGFSLTRRGLNTVKNGFGPDDFFHLLDTYLQRFNWASGDLYPSLEIIQQAVLFSCYLLHRKAKAYVQADELSRDFIRAFPTILNTVERYPFSEPEDLVQRAYCVRFLTRFCAYFGLVTIKIEEKLPLDINDRVQTTPLFKNILRWKVY
ncbi:MAG: DUF1841 family protein [Desulfobacterales bacterium]|nr:DUF1841 family protein [Desulfobacterales bacterium]